MLKENPVTNVKRPRVRTDSMSVGGKELEQLLDAAEADGPRSAALGHAGYNGLRVDETLARAAWLRRTPGSVPAGDLIRSTLVNVSAASNRLILPQRGATMMVPALRWSGRRAPSGLRVFSVLSIVIACAVRPASEGGEANRGAGFVRGARSLGERDDVAVGKAAWADRAVGRWWASTIRRVAASAVRCGVHVDRRAGDIDANERIAAAIAAELTRR